MSVAGRAVIFDCDGVLVDSETLSAGVARSMARELRVELGGAEALELVRGRKVADWTAELAVLAGRSLPEGFVGEFRRRCLEAFDGGLERVDGVEDVVRGLDLPYCCASSAPRDKIEYTLGSTGLLPLFAGRIHSAYEVGSWKPDPDLFLHAAAWLGTDPGRCAVVEDSVPGVQAGRRAGMTVFGYAPDPTGATARTLRSHGALPFGSMTDLPALLGRWAAADPTSEDPRRENREDAHDVPA